MKWSRAVHHLQTLADECDRMAAQPATLFPLRVTQLWAVGDILDRPAELEVVTVALVVDRPVAEVPWGSEPRGARHWSSAVGLPRAPVRVWWRSAHAPVWNHRIVAPALVWDVDGGPRTSTMDGLRDGTAVDRLPEPSADARAARVRDELDVSLAALRRATGEFHERRWQRGALEPVADELGRAAEGYLDVLDAL